MPIVNNNLIYKIALGLFSKMGAPKENATTLAQHLTDANLAGHDSHGIIRTMQYIKEIDEGTLNPRAQPEIVQEAGGSAWEDDRRFFHPRKRCHAGVPWPVQFLCGPLHGNA